MAHGGLAQAGKVKGLTPKIPKKERTEKVKTGRAAKRDQYKRMMERKEEQERTGRRVGPNKQELSTKH